MEIEHFIFIIVLILALPLGWLIFRPKPKQKKIILGKAYVVDADDIVVKGVKIRLYGIDAPEHRQPAQKDGRWYNQGKWVKGELIQAVGGKYVRVDVQGYDKFGRTLGIVFCDGNDICEWMVRSGLAIVAYSDKYKVQEQHARQNRLGIWGNQVSYDPKHWRHGKRVYLS